MKAIKNKKRYDPRWHHSERQDSKTRVINEGITVSFDNFTATEEKEYTGGGPGYLPAALSAAGTKPGDSSRRTKPGDSSRRTRTPKEKKAADDVLANLGSGGEISASELPEQEEVAEGGCGGPEMGPEAAEAPVMDLSPDEAYDTGYADAVEEIMNSISHLLHEPVGEPVAIEINEDGEEAMEEA